MDNNYTKLIKKIKNSNQEIDDIDSEYKCYLKKLNNLILMITKTEEKYTLDYFKKHSFEQLKKENECLFYEILKDNYRESFANPDFCCDRFGKKLGKRLSFVYFKYLESKKYAFSHNTDILIRYLKFYDELNGVLLSGNINKIDEILNQFMLEIKLIEEEEIIKEEYVFNIYNNVVTNDDLTNLKYLFKFGGYVNKSEIKMAEFLVSYPQEKIKKAAEIFVQAYDRSFDRGQKRRKNRKFTKVIFNLGQEIFAREIIMKLEKLGYKPFISKILELGPNNQYKYDHRFDETLYIDTRYIKNIKNFYQTVIEKYSKYIKNYAGFFCILQFGESFQSPLSKKFAIVPSKVQSEQLNDIIVFKKNYLEKYAPKREWSYTGVAIPSPAIGENFKNIFYSILEINTMDSYKYEKIQQSIINALDLADFIHVKGQGNNKTDIKVKMNDIYDPLKQTNFLNCGADVNIPWGEVFTTPVLKGTEGILHVNEVYYNEFKYNNLKLTFENGYIKNFSCENFRNEESNKKYIINTLFSFHKTLPLGEFAIGTNTYAYVAAKKYNIIGSLPGLIKEKMGPHFAIGDTCFAWSEDLKVFNILDRKEMIAKENKKTKLRKTNVENAYVNVHVDITVPFDELEFITVVTKNKQKIDVIKNGRFIIKGTELLNEPFYNI